MSRIYSDLYGKVMPGALLQIWQAADEIHSLDADGDDLADKAEDVLLVVGAVRVADDLLRVGLVSLNPVLVDHPFQRRPVAEAVLGDFGWDAFKREIAVVRQRSLVFRVSRHA